MSYVVTPYIAGVAQMPQTFNTAATTDTLSGLSNGTTYTFTVAAVNAIGEGPQSGATTAVTAGVPSAPNVNTFNMVMQSGSTYAIASWTAPPANGSPITAYVITLYDYPTPPGGTTPVVTSQTFNSLATTETVGPVNSADTYQLTVAAVNSFGEGPANGTQLFLFAGSTLPGAVTGVSASAGTTGAVVSWTPADPATGSPASGYVITPYVAGVAQAPQTFNSTATTETIGVSRGIAYTFTVAGVNAEGQGPESAQSNAVTVP
jgi:predicted RNA-binding protein with TRAM domain